MRIAHLKIVRSRQRPDLLSVRGPKGQGSNDSAHEHITQAGFVDGEDVVLISKADFERLTSNP